MPYVGSFLLSGAGFMTQHTETMHEIGELLSVTLKEQR